MRNTLRGGGVLAVAALVISGLATTPAAHADPSFTPDSDDIVGVGSDTTEFVMNKLAAGFNARAIGGTQQMASFNATGTATIVPRNGAAAIPRPNGSSAGIDALQAESDLSFARSSRGPNPTGDEGLLFFPYAKDTLGYVFSKPGSHVNKNLGAKQLKAIYTCQKTNWKAFGMPKGHIHAGVPQAGSGTRTFFLASIGVDETQIQDAIAQPNTKCNVHEVQEHDPTAVIGDKNAIAPFSLARYTILRKAVKSTIGYAAKAKFNVKRNVYNVIRADDVDALGQFFDDTSWICTKKAAKEIISGQGFTRLPAGQCGVAIVA
jgi:ABC-type phosphate transport system substrate-binding protein